VQPLLLATRLGAQTSPRLFIHTHAGFKRHLIPMPWTPGEERVREKKMINCT
jgi:hypothetical protein